MNKVLGGQVRYLIPSGLKVLAGIIIKNEVFHAAVICPLIRSHGGQGENERQRQVNVHTIEDHLIAVIVALKFGFGERHIDIAVQIEEKELFVLIDNTVENFIGVIHIPVKVC